MDPNTDTAPQPDQPQTADATILPERIAHFLSILDLLLAYGHHLGSTLRLRAAARYFPIIARCFGTKRLDIILLHLYRGIMRARALRAVLLARAARGRDLTAPAVRYYTPSDPDQPAPEPADTAAAPEQRTAPRAARQVAAAEPLRTFSQLPSMEELEADARRRPPGQVMIDICNDFGVVPSLCHTGLWTHLWDVITWYGGNSARFYRVMEAKQDAYRRQYGRPSEADTPGDSRAGMREVLGFFIGEVPVDPPAPAPDAPALAGPEPAAAAAARPP